MENDKSNKDNNSQEFGNETQDTSNGQVSQKKNQNNGDESPQKSKSFTSRDIKLLYYGLVGIFIGGIVLAINLQQEGLEIVAAVKWEERKNDQNDKEKIWYYIAEGTVLSSGGTAIPKAFISALALDKNETTISYKSLTADKFGNFKIEDNVDKSNVEEIKIKAVSPHLFHTFWMRIKGNIVISIKDNITRKLRGTNYIGISIVAMFVIGIIANLFKRAVLLRYGLVVFFSIGISILMIWYIADCARIFDHYSNQNKAVENLGFAKIFRGTYITNFPNETIISLTSPKFSVNNPKEFVTPTKGFGAPIWVIFLSVIGSALFTISLLIRETTNRREQSDSKLIEKNIEDLLQHQFFILFAPISGIFMYQTLLVAKAASEPLTVAIAALGSGLTLNGLLTRAIAYSEKWIKPPSKNSKTDNPIHIKEENLEQTKKDQA